MLVLLAGVVLGVVPAAAQTSSVPSPVVEQLKADVAVLTADSLYGRGYVPDGALRAARYIRRELQAAGVSPLDTTGYFQSFPLTVDVVTEPPSLVINGDSLEPGFDFLPHGITGGGDIRPTDEILSVGTGLVMPDRGVDPYDSVDVSGAVVVMEGQVPEAIRRDSTIMPRQWSVMTRIEEAASRGAAAVLVVVERLIYSMYPYETSVPVVSVRTGALPASLETVSVALDLAANRSVTSQNVVGRIEGTAQTDSILMLTAHYDHVGSWGESVHFPGANDNASGTALLLALARYFEEHPLPYTVVCAAFSGEEHGLIGSRYFAAHPPFDLSRVRLLLNFDMVGSGTNGFMAVGGVDFPRMYERLAAVGDSLGIGPIGKRKNVPNSDHYPLTERGVPGLFLYARGGDQPYHHVEDVMDTLTWSVLEDAYVLAIQFLETL